MMAIPLPQEWPIYEPDFTGTRPVGGPVAVAWREGTLTRAKELESLCAWVMANHPRANSEVLANAVPRHLEAAREAAEAPRLDSKRRFRMPRNGALLERAMSNLDAAEAQLLNFAPPSYVLGQLPCLLRHVQCHLIPTDPRRQEFERIARRLGVKDVDHPLLQNAKELSLTEKHGIVEEERGKIVTVVRAASSAALREQTRLRSFRNVLVVTSVLMSLLAIGIAALGFFRPTMIPLCFAPEESGQAVVVCPTAQSPPFPTARQTATDGQLPDTSAQILAWALVFGYAQQLFTRLIDRQGQNVLESVRGADRPQAAPSPP
jgi:hypothetical protein